jgi:hypothetical protein
MKSDKYSFCYKNVCHTLLLLRTYQERVKDGQKTIHMQSRVPEKEVFNKEIENIIADGRGERWIYIRGVEASAPYFNYHKFFVHHLKT